jgi:hypothetical protein
LGEFVGGEEPEFEGAVEGAVEVHGNARNAAGDGFVHAGQVFRRGGIFEGQQRSAERSGQVAGEQAADG